MNSLPDLSQDEGIFNAIFQHDVGVLFENVNRRVLRDGRAVSDVKVSLDASLPNLDFKLKSVLKFFRDGLREGFLSNNGRSFVLQPVQETIYDMGQRVKYKFGKAIEGANPFMGDPDALMRGRAPLINFYNKTDFLNLGSDDHQNAGDFIDNELNEERLGFIIKGIEINDIEAALNYQTPGAAIDDVAALNVLDEIENEHPFAVEQQEIGEAMRDEEIPGIGETIYRRGNRLFVLRNDEPVFFPGTATELTRLGMESVRLEDRHTRSGLVF
jgi:hypothetical protein